MNIFSRISQLILILIKASKTSLGQKGHVYIDLGHTQPATENYSYFKVLTEASVTYVNKYGGDDVTAKTLAAGDEVFGFFSTLSVTSVSGEIRAYII